MAARCARVKRLRGLKSCRTTVIGLPTLMENLVPGLLLFALVFACGCVIALSGRR